MVYGQLSGAESLRIIEAGFNRQAAHHYHLGTGEVKRSTLADANHRSSPALYAAVVERLMAQVHRQLRRDSQQALYLLDSTPITLSGRGFDDWTATTRTQSQGIKRHVLYAAHEQVPRRHSFSAANINDVTEGAKLPIEAGATYVFDKGYCDYNWWAAIDAQGHGAVPTTMSATRRTGPTPADVVRMKNIPDSSARTPG